MKVGCRRSSLRLVLTLLVLLLEVAAVRAEEPLHQDSRCNCKCPDTAIVNGGDDDKPGGGVVSGSSSDDVDDGDDGRADAHMATYHSMAGGSESGTTARSIYINSSVAPDECDCEHVVLPKLGELFYVFRGFILRGCS